MAVLTAPESDWSTLASPGTILAMVRDGQRVPEAVEGDEVEVILDRTPAYAESGGLG